MALNYLYYGDNLDVLRDEIPDEYVDLVYLDPPFNSNRSYNVLFANKSGDDAQAQIEAFDDTWTWSHEAEQQYHDLITGGAPAKVADAIEAMRKLVGDNDVLAYLVMMTPRLVELHRVLKPTGSLYLHCDPTASHYLKIILDAIFDPTNFRNEIIWRRSNAHNKTTRQYGPIHDAILYYGKSKQALFHAGRRPYSKAYIEDRFKKEDERGRYQLNYLTGPGTRQGQSGVEWRGFDPTNAGRHWAIPASLRGFLPDRGKSMKTFNQLEALLAQDLIVFPKKIGGQPMYKQYVGPGVPYQDVWAYQPNTRGVLYESDEHIDEDVKWLESEDEKLGFDTQKPVGLLARIIETSSDPGGVVLDPFCGCGTTVDAAQKLGRKWVGIDITYIAIDLITKRLRDTHGDEVMEQVEVRGIPRDVAGARALFDRSPFDFERWAVSLVNGQPNLKQVGDKGVDGVIRFPLDGTSKNIGKVLVSVKGGKSPGPTAVRDLVGTVESQRAEMGVLVTLDEPTRGMVDAANHSGLYTWEWNGETYPKVQTITVAQLLNGERPAIPPALLPYMPAKRSLKLAAEQTGLFDSG